jgi:small-conductance mechanosensitive channel
MKNKIVIMVALIAGYLSVTGRVDARFWEIVAVGVVWIFWKDIKEAIRKK